MHHFHLISMDYLLHILWIASVGIHQASSCAQVTYAESFPLVFNNADDYMCPNGWLQRSSSCYHVSTVALSWAEADIACSSLANGGRLAQIDELGTNLFIGEEVQKEADISKYWIGLLKKIGQYDAVWSSGESTSVTVGHWSPGHPDVRVGRCTSAIKDMENQFPWELEWCERKLPFVCETKACLKDEYQCVSGQCIPASYKCDGQDNCGDNSDEEDCGSQQCRYVEGGSSGTINSKNYLKYTDCQWIIQVPVGSQVTLKFTSFATEELQDVVDVYVGGRTMQSSQLAGSLSGSLSSADLPTFVSTNNLMIVVFTSDGTSSNFAGFSADYKTTFECSMEFLPGFSQPDSQPLDSKVVSGVSTCQSDCRSNLNCNGFTYNKSTRRCNFHRNIDKVVKSSCCDYWAKTCPGTTGTPELSSVPGGSGGELSATATSQLLMSPLYPVGYLVNTKIAWIVMAPTQWDILTLQKLDLDLGPGDILTIRDGNLATSPLLATYTGDGMDGPEVIITTGMNAYIFLDTSSRDTGRGILFRYTSGCNYEISAKFGSIFSPGFPLGAAYPNFASCHWSIKSPDNQPMLVKSHAFDLEDGKDFLEMYEGDSAEGTALHTEADGFTGKVSIADIIVSSGKLYSVFNSDATGSDTGFNFTFSIDCPDPGLNESTTNFIRTPAFTYGSAFTVSCKTGYYFAQEEFTDCGVRPLDATTKVDLECLPGGMWNIDRVPTCSAVYCGLPPEVNNGFIKESTSVFFEGEVTYECFEGFTLSGTDPIECMNDGVWEDEPTCDAEECTPAPENPDNGNFTVLNGDGQAYGSVILYQCFDGYQMQQGSPIVYCGIDEGSAEWSDATEVECKALPCLIPDVPNGMTDKSEKIYFGETTLASCDDGYQLNTTGASYTMTCMENQEFDYVPVCEDVEECEDTAPCTGTGSMCTNTVGSYVCSCEQGYRLENEKVCEDIDECDQAMGGCSDSCQNMDGSYFCECKSGYQLFTQDGFNGFEVSNREDGFRQGDVLHVNHTCVRRTCPDPGTSYKGNIIKEDDKDYFYYEDRVTVQCQLGYVIEGTLDSSDTIECMETGMWDRAMPNCTEVSCAAFELKENLQNSPAFSPATPVKYGEKVTLNCSVDGLNPPTFQRFQTCLYNGSRYTLMGDPQECGVIDCGIPSEVGGLNLDNFPDNTEYNATFEFKCNEGFRLIGNSSEDGITVRCREDGRWDLNDLRCTGPQCSDPGRPAGGFQVVTSYEEGQVVSFGCDREGFNATPAQVMCRDTQMWDVDITNIECKDVEVPVFTGCAEPIPITVKKYDTLSRGAPEVTDNSGSVASLTSSVPLGRPVENDVEIMWEAMDDAGNKADCSYDVTLQNENAPTFPDGCPDSKTVYVSNENVNYEETFVHANVSSAESTIERSFFRPQSLAYSADDVMKAYEFQQIAEDEEGNSASCIFQVLVMPDKCKPWSVRKPKNGQKSEMPIKDSADVVVGWTIEMTCNNDYVFYDQEQTLVYKCEGEEDFTNANLGMYVPDCVAPNEASYEQEFELSYSGILSGNVDAYVNEIKSKLTQAANDLETICRTNVGNTATPDIVVSYLKKRFEQNMFVTFGVKYIEDANDDAKACGLSVESHFEGIATSLQGAKALFEIKPNNLEAKFGNYEATTFNDFKCPEGQLLVDEVIDGVSIAYCTPCPAGYYMTNNTCELCPIGTYTSEASQAECAPCPNGTYTYSEGAASVGMCKDECPAPLTSSTRLPPCMACPSGQYWAGPDMCDDCPADTKTRGPQGAADVSYCYGECPKGYFSHDGYMPCRPCPLGYYQDEEGAMSCKMCSDAQSTFMEGADEFSKCTANVTALCIDIDCGHNGTCVIEDSRAMCECNPGFTGSSCETDIDECASNPCYYGGTCVDEEDGYSCQCPSVITYKMNEEQDKSRGGPPFNFIYGKTEEDCSESCLEDESCLQATFQVVANGDDICALYDNIVQQTTEDNLFTLWTKETVYVPQFNGSRCEIEQDDCPAENVCQNEGQCRDLVQDFTCVCPANNEFNGPRCADKVSPCSKITCENGGTCDEISNVRGVCRCVPGYTGDNCETNIDDCAFEPCLFGGTCMDVVDKFVCLCPDGFTGTRCETRPANLCQPNPCGSMGRCFEDYTAVPPTALCVCDMGYTSGQYFTEWYNKDSPGTDMNGGDTETREKHGDVCSSGKNPVGAKCRRVDDRISSDDTTIGNEFEQDCSIEGIICLNANQTGDACADYEVSYICEAGGNKCVQIDECLEEQCEEADSCYDRVDSYSCNCKAGYEGFNCQHNVDECARTPCLNGGTCEDGINTRTCKCADGYAGVNCQQNINDCAGNVCYAAGSLRCVDQVYDYECQCRPGYTGKNCSVDIDECLSDPCLHNGECTDHVNRFSCACETGWIGDTCADRENFCSSQPCQNNAECYNQAEEYYCACPAGFFGTNCEVGPDVCSVANPCVNGGVCQTDGSCSCPDDYKAGKGCECEVHYCGENSICENGGICMVESLGGFTCSCPPGFAGDMCETNIDDCAGRNCDTGSCVDGVETAFCDCPVGKTGPTCSKGTDHNVDMCFHGQGGATTLYPFRFAAREFTLGVWVRYYEPMSTGVFLTLYSTVSQTSPLLGGWVARFSDTEVMISYDNGASTTSLMMPTAINVNDGDWHYVTMIWDETEVKFMVDSVSAGTETGTSFDLPEFGLVRLGNYQSVEDGSMSDAFSGCVSLVQIWNTTLSVTAMANIFNAKTKDAEDDEGFTSALLLDWSWGGYGSGPGLKKTNPTTRGNTVCTMGQVDNSGQCSNEGIPPTVTNCQDDHEEQIMNFQYVNANWTENDIFGASGSRSQNHHPPTLWETGQYPVVYNAWSMDNQEGSRAMCQFEVFVRYGDCADPDAPAGVTLTCEDDANLPFNRYCEPECISGGEAFVFPTPQFYTCGPLGTWNTQNPRVKMRFPTCGAIGGSKLEVEFSWTFDLIADVNNNAIIDNLKQVTMTNIEAWDVVLRGQGAAYSFCAMADCSDVTVTVTADADKNAVIKISADSVNTALGDDVPTADAIRQAVLNDGTFYAPDAAGADSINPDTFYLNQMLSCQDNYHVVGDRCVECSAGTYYDASSKTCMYCAAGTYQDTSGQTECKPCADGQTTETYGAVAQDECYDECGPGNYYNASTSSCVACSRGFYQEEMGCTYCLPCPLGTTTRNVSATSEDLCYDECSSGKQLTPAGTCEDCPMGSYRTVGLQAVCEDCPGGRTTVSTGSKVQGDCSVVVCDAGQVLEGNVCVDCEMGTYRADNMAECESCGDNYRTDQAGSTSVDECKFYCKAGSFIQVNGEVMTCVGCPEDTYKEADEYYADVCTPCPVDTPTTLGVNSTSMNDCRFGKCTAGQTVDPADMSKCLSCGYGYYQPNDRPTTDNCTQCPDGTSTNTTQAATRLMCYVVCKSGEEYDLEAVECMQCAQGYFKDNKEDEMDNYPNARFSMCQKCPVGRVTNSTGAMSIDACNIADCQKGTHLSNDLQSCLPCEKGSYQDTMWQRQCKKCPEESTTEKAQGADSAGDCNLFPNRTVMKIMIYFNIQWLNDFKDENTAMFKDLKRRVLQLLKIDVLDNVAAFRYREDTETNAGSPQLISFSQGSTVAIVAVELQKSAGDEAIQELIDELNRAVNSGSLSDPDNGNQYVPLPTLPTMKNSFATFVVKAGEEVRFCMDGDYFDFSDGKCYACAKGHYQPDTARDVCHRCPEGTTTNTERTNSTDLAGKDVCQGCPVGQYSANQLCVDCARDTYNDLTDQIECKPCSKFYSTLKTGATSVQECLNVCQLNGTNSYCQNDGTCAFDIFARVATCTCSTNYEGDRCQNRKDLTGDSMIPYIIGGSVGGVVVLLLLLLFIAWCCRRPREGKSTMKRKQLQEFPMYMAQPETVYMQGPPSQAGYYPNSVVAGYPMQVGTPTYNTGTMNAGTVPYMFYKEDEDDYGGDDFYGSQSQNTFYQLQ